MHLKAQKVSFFLTLFLFDLEAKNMGKNLMKLNLLEEDVHWMELKFLHSLVDLIHILHRDQHKTNFLVVLYNE